MFNCFRAFGPRGTHPKNREDFEQEEAETAEFREFVDAKRMSAFHESSVEAP